MVREIKWIWPAFAAAMALFIALLFAPASYAMDNATNYEPQYGPHVGQDIGGNDYWDSFIVINGIPENEGTNKYEIFLGGDAYNGNIEGVTYDLESNTLTLENVKQPKGELSAHVMGDDFTIEVLGDCELGMIDISGDEYEGSDGAPYYWGGSLNLVGSGKLTVGSEACLSEDNPWGLTLWGEGCESVLNIDKHVSLKAYGYKPEPAIEVIRTAGRYDDKVVLVDGKNITSVYPKYRMKGEIYEGPGSLKNYWVDSSEVVITGDHKTVLDGRKVVLEEQYLEYNGKVQLPKILTIGGREYVEGTDYEVTASPASPKNPGKYEITVKGIGNCVGETTATYEIFPGSTPAKIKAVGKTVSLKNAALKKKALTVKASKYVKLTDVKGAKYSIASAKNGSKNFKSSFKIDAKTGKITVKKGLKKGTYAVKVKIVKAKTNYYNKDFMKSVTFKIKVK